MVILVVPVAVALFTYKTCKDLSAAEHLREEQKEAKAALQPAGQAAG